MSSIGFLRIAVLLTVHNRKANTLECLENLYAQSDMNGIALDTYLVDDGCTDGTAEAIKERFPEVHIIKGDGHLYWNRGMWTAWNAAAKGDHDYYLWLNDDTYLQTDAIACLLAAAKETNSESVIVGATTNKELSALTYGGRIKGEIPRPSGKLVEVDYFNGNIVLIPRCIFEKVGNLDYYFTHSKGDFDYGLRARKMGIKIYQAAQTIGICEAHPSIDKWCNPDIPFLQRWKAMWRPNGMPPHETFHLERRHYGLMPATFHYCTILLRCCFPKIWMRKK
jgi:GT2 family glycosyltransferase